MTSINFDEDELNYLDDILEMYLDDPELFNLTTGHNLFTVQVIKRKVSLAYDHEFSRNYLEN
jgi:hypothetical protein